MSNADAIRQGFELQVGWTRALGSPFTAELLQRLADDLDARGPTFALVGDWPGHALGDAVSLRLAGALHAAALTGRDAALAAEYPEARPDWDMNALWPHVRAFLAREHDWVRDFLKSPPQTNETRRAIAFLPAFFAAARVGPLHLLEIGASAGLNQMWDRFRYETATWAWGDVNGPRIDTDWRIAPPEPPLHVAVASRRACDQNPLDVRSDADMLRLEAYVWADQAERLERLKRAIALARAADVRVERADAGAWIAAQLAPPLPEGTTVIYHSVVWQYLEEATRAAITACIEDAGARATPAQRLAWVRYEPNLALGLDGAADGFGVDVQIWPSGARRALLRTNGHAQFVDAV